MANAIINTSFVGNRLRFTLHYGNVRSAVKKKHHINTKFILERMEELNQKEGRRMMPKGAEFRGFRGTDAAYSIHTVAQEMGLDYAGLSRRVNGEYALTLNEALELADILRCEVNEFDGR